MLDSFVAPKPANDVEETQDEEDGGGINEDVTMNEDGTMTFDGP